MQRSATARFTMRNLETAIGQRDDWSSTRTTAKLPTTDATLTSHAATRSQAAPRMSSHGLAQREEDTVAAEQGKKIATHLKASGCGVQFTRRCACVKLPQNA